jgi:transcriptional regulator with XRE-family HTH domain
LFLIIDKNDFLNTMRNNMPKKSPIVTENTATKLQSLGARAADRRKALRVSATVAAEAAGISRVTLHRIEKGEPSVTMGAWSNAIAALGLQLQLQDEKTASPAKEDRAGWWPVRITLADYPHLKALAWQVHGTDHLTPVEAFDIYERNARHLDLQTLTEQEQSLWEALQQAFGKRATHV